MFLKQVKLFLLVALCRNVVVEATYTYNYPSGATAAYNSGTTAYYQPYTYVGFPAGARVTYTQPCTVYYQQATTVYNNAGPIYYPADTHVNYPAGTQMTYAPRTGVWASGSTTTGMRYDSFNGNNYGIAQYPNGCTAQTTAPQAAYFAPGTPTTQYYQAGGTTQFGPSGPYIGYQTTYKTSTGQTAPAYCSSYAGTGYPIYTAGYSG